MKQRERQASAQDYPKDFISDNEWDFVESLAACKGDGVKNKTVNYGAPLRKGSKNMSKKDPQKWGTQVVNKNGKVVTLLNPSEKGTKYAAELVSNTRFTNDCFIKTDKNGNEMQLTKAQRAYRSGYLDAQKDSRNCWKAKNGIKGKNRKGSFLLGPGRT